MDDSEDRPATIKQTSPRLPGINPVTIRQTNPRWPGNLCLTLARLHIEAGGELLKPLSVVVYEEKEGVPFDESHVRANFVVDEDEFISGLKHLFPNGELNQ